MVFNLTYYSLSINWMALMKYRSDEEIRDWLATNPNVTFDEIVERDSSSRITRSLLLYAKEDATAEQIIAFYEKKLHEKLQSELYAVTVLNPAFEYSAAELLELQDLFGEDSTIFSSIMLEVLKVGLFECCKYDRTFNIGIVLEAIERAQGFPATVEQILCKNKDGETLLHCAGAEKAKRLLIAIERAQGFPATVEQILCKDDNGSTPLHNNDSGEVDPKKVELLLIAIERAQGFPATVEQILCKNNDGETPLHFVGAAKTMKVFLAAIEQAPGFPATVEQILCQHDNGNTSLHRADGLGIQLLLTAIERAQGFPATVEQILCEDDDGNTPLHRADGLGIQLLLIAIERAQGFPATVEQILCEDEYGDTPLSSDNAKTVVLLLAALRKAKIPPTVEMLEEELERSNFKDLLSSFILEMKKRWVQQNWIRKDVDCQPGEVEEAKPVLEVFANRELQARIFEFLNPNGENNIDHSGRPDDGEIFQPWAQRRIESQDMCIQQLTAQVKELQPVLAFLPMLQQLQLQQNALPAPQSRQQSWAGSVREEAPPAHEELFKRKGNHAFEDSAAKRIKKSPPSSPGVMNL
jgi:hypothetical protein